MGRLEDLWEEPRRLPVLYSLSDSGPAEGEDTVEQLLRERQEAAADNEGPTGLSTWTMIQASREIVYERESEDGPRLTYVMYSLNLDTGFIEVSPMLSTVDLDTNELKSTLAAAHVLDVPVVANTDQDEPDLVDAYQELLENGFEAPSDDTDTQRLKLTDAHPATRRGFDALGAASPLSPVQVALAREELRTQLGQYVSADRLLATLRLGISRLQEKLHSDDRNENALQAVLTDFPLLFGLEYRRVIPKHKLGSEYEMDYALERMDGVVDLLEIESSTLDVYTKAGNPSRYLTHAEQQVLDWLDWIDAHAPYARTGPKGLVGLIRPVGYVVVGRSDTWTDRDHDRLRRRNQALSGAIRILTYDHVLANAEMMLNRLCGTPGTEEPPIAEP